jgi:hypothetical protein
MFPTIPGNVSIVADNIPSEEVHFYADQERQHNTDSMGSETGKLLSNLSLDDEKGMEDPNTRKYYWKRTALEKIDKRITEFESPPNCLTSDRTRGLVRRESSLPTENSGVHRYFAIAELLEMIVDLVGPEAQL